MFLLGAGAGMLTGLLIPAAKGARYGRLRPMFLGLLSGAGMILIVSQTAFKEDDIEKEVDQIRKTEAILVRDYNNLQTRASKGELSEHEAVSLLERDIIPPSRHLLDQTVALEKLRLSGRNREVLPEIQAICRLRLSGLESLAAGLREHEQEKLAKSKADIQEAARRAGALPRVERPDSVPEWFYLIPLIVLFSRLLKGKYRRVS
jgi:hypothetical protein